MKETYCEQFAEPGSAEAYDAGQYGEDSYGTIMWEIEKEMLRSILDHLKHDIPAVDFMDFACGTGRVISFVENYVATSCGVDVSKEMLRVAATRVHRSRLLHTDLTGGSDRVEGKYDLITAFRFFLNAEPRLRRAAMHQLALLLKDSKSRLVFNNHGNPFSHKLAMWPVHQLLRLGRGYQTAGNYLTDGQVRGLVNSAGLVITESYGYGLLSARAINLLGYQRVRQLEKDLARRRYLEAIGVNRLYVCGLA